MAHLFVPESSVDPQLIEVAFVASVLSACGSLFILLNWTCVKSARISFMRLVVAMAFANLMSAASYIFSFIDWRFMPRDWPPADPSSSCLVQAVAMLVFENASIFWTVAIACTLHQQVVMRSATIGRLEPWYHILCWGVPLCTALTLWLTGSLGPADGPHTAWCWISGGSNATGGGNVSAAASHSAAAARADPQVGAVSNPDDARELQLLAFYLPLVLAFAFNLVAYVQVGRAFGRMAREGAVAADKEAQVQLRLRLYLAAFLVVWIAPLVHRALQIFDIDPHWLRCVPPPLAASRPRPPSMPSLPGAGCFTPRRSARWARSTASCTAVTRRRSGHTRRPSTG